MLDYESPKANLAKVVNMEIEYKCKKQVMPNVWHHNLVVDKNKMVYKENSEIPASPETVIEWVTGGVIFLNDGWIVDC